MCAEAGINHIPPSAELEMLAHGKTTGMAPATLAIRGFVSSRSQRPEQVMLALKSHFCSLKKNTEIQLPSTFGSGRQGRQGHGRKLVKPPGTYHPIPHPTLKET